MLRTSLMGTVTGGSTCQCRGHGFDPWSGKIPYAQTPQLEREWPLLAITKEKPTHSNRDPAEPKVNK